MPIGDQKYDNVEVSATELKKRYDDLIREALLVARPGLEITRADEVAMPGAITSDILTRIMHSDFVVADVSYPNPNVFYELGLRHACRLGTIIIRDSKAPKAPFDIAHLRHIEYENTASGLKALAEAFRQYFTHITLYPGRPDNQFLELAKFTGYQFPDYTPKKETLPPELEAMMALAGSPEFMGLAISASQGNAVEPAQFFQAAAAQPDVFRKILGALANAGKFPGLGPLAPVLPASPAVEPRKKGPSHTKPRHK